MESEERPAKVRRLDHAPREGIGESVDKGSPSSDVAAIDGISTAEQPPAVTPENDELSNLTHLPSEVTSEVPKLSKNQLKKQQRLERWEAGRDDRKIKRKEKIKAKKERKRQAWAEHRANNPEDEHTLHQPASRPPRHIEGLGIQVPITVIFDCDFEDLMFDNELKSLGLQITRCYSDNRKAPYRCHLGVSSFGGKLKERFDGILAKQYTSWKGFKFLEEDFVRASEMAEDWMAGEKGGNIAGALKRDDEAKGEETEEAEEEGEVVYLSSESDITLERLKPNSTYIIGGLVDKNRHKGVCYKRAMNRGIKTAKLPIGEFLQMNSRQVLVTNHVLEIMLKWLECKDWGKAFMEVIPKRKGGVLKSEAELGDGEEQDTVDDEENGDGEVEGALSPLIEETTNKGEAANLSTEPQSKTQTGKGVISDQRR